jgi:hypothetical protein
VSISVRHSWRIGPRVLESAAVLVARREAILPKRSWSCVDYALFRGDPVSAEAATYTQVPSDFLGDLSAAAQKAAAFQLMFRADGKNFDDSHGFGTSLFSSETLKCSTVTGANIASTVAKFHGVEAILSDDQDDDAKQAAAKFNVVYNHFNLLKTIEAGFGLDNLGRVDALPSTAPITGIWR